MILDRSSLIIRHSGNFLAFIVHQECPGVREISTRSQKESGKVLFVAKGVSYFTHFFFRMNFSILHFNV